MRFVGRIDGEDVEMDITRPPRGDGQSFCDEAVISDARKGMELSVPVSTIVEFLTEECGMDVVPRRSLREKIKDSASPDMVRKAGLVRDRMEGRTGSPYMRGNLRVVK